MKQQEETKLQTLLEQKSEAMIQHFKQFDTDEYKAENPLDLRKEKLFAEFENVKNKIEDKDFVIEGDALNGLQSLFKNQLQSVAKGVETTDSFISLYDILDGAKKKAVMKNKHIQFIGEIFAKVSYGSIEEARELQKVQHALKPIYNGLWVDNMEIKFAAKCVNELEQKWMTEGLPQEDSEQIITEEVKEETKA